MGVRWVDEIKAAFEALDGAARYDDLYEYIIRTTKRELTKEWKATVRRTIEDHSSDSLNHRAQDVFRKFGYGHWGLRDSNIAESELLRRGKLSPQEVVAEVFVREHWRRSPATRIDPTDLPNDDRLFPVAAWCTNNHLEVELASGVKLSTPIGWYPRLLGASQQERANIELSPWGIHWPDVDEDISIKNMLLGTQGIPPKAATL